VRCINTNPPFWALRYQIWFDTQENGLPVIDLACEGKLGFGSIGELTIAYDPPDDSFKFFQASDEEAYDRDERESSLGKHITADVPIIQVARDMRVEVGLNRTDDVGSVLRYSLPFGIGGALGDNPLEVCRTGVRGTNGQTLYAGIPSLPTGC
jgi:hypothetical protein